MVRKIVKESSDGVIVEAKQEYTRQLCNVIKPVVYESIFNIYTDIVAKSTNLDNVLVEFQEGLKEIPKWNADIITEHVDNVLSSCTFFNDLLSVVFLSNVRILTSVRMNQSGKKKIKIVVPTNEKFIHEIFKNVAKNIYNDPYLYSIKKYNSNVTNNIREVFDLIDTTIEDTIRNLLPFQNIIESYIKHNEEDEYAMTKERQEPEDVFDDEEIEDTEAKQPAIDDDEISEKEDAMENFFGKEQTDEQLKSIPVGKPDPYKLEEELRCNPEEENRTPKFFDDEDTPDPKPSVLQ